MVLSFKDLVSVQVHQSLRADIQGNHKISCSCASADCQAWFLPFALLGIVNNEQLMKWIYRVPSADSITTGKAESNLQLLTLQSVTR